VRFVKFLREANEDICLEIPRIKANVSDDDLRQIVRQEFGIDAVKICNETREKQDAILKVMKEVVGTNIRQLARITRYRLQGSGRPETESLSLCFLLHIAAASIMKLTSIRVSLSETNKRALFT
jgi:hypothetical protein